MENNVSGCVIVIQMRGGTNEKIPHWYVLRRISHRVVLRIHKSDTIGVAVMKTFVRTVKFAEHVCPDHPVFMCESCKKKKLITRRLAKYDALAAYLKGRR